MNFKSILVTLGISISGVYAAQAVGEPVDANPELSALVKSCLESPDSPNLLKLRSYIKSIQDEVYHLVDLGKIDEATAKFDAVIERLTPLYDSMPDDHRFSSGEETLHLIAEYIRLHTDQTSY